VFDRHGALFSTSEDCAGLEHSLAWKPSGNLIASTVTKPNKHIVAFFEKNGLQHGEFKLRTSMDVVELEWNCDSTILLVWGIVKDGHVLEFWTIGNYHWYLKQSLALPQLHRPKWDQEDPNLCQFISRSDGQEYLSSLVFALSADTSLGRTEEDLALVAVTDGHTVKLTPMREAVIPPPMSAYEIHVESQVVSVMFQSPCPDSGTLGDLRSSSNNLAVLTHNKLFLFSVDPAGGEDKDSDVVRITGAGGNGYIVQTSRHAHVNTLETGCLEGMSNFVWFGGKVFASVDFPQSALVILKSDGGRLVEESRVQTETSVHLIAAGDRLMVQLQDARCLQYQDGLLIGPIHQFPRLCSTVIPTEQGVLGLNDRFKLYLNEREIAGNITSMFLHSHFLLATTMDHRLIALPIGELSGSTLRWEEAGSRRVERGSRLVNAVPFHSKTILQMPRGNLETIQPRSLTILLLQNLLNQCRFKDAFLLARRQRINLNLLVDHSYSDFIKNITQFVKQVAEDTDHMNIFLAELKEEDVCTTMYAAQYSNREQTKVEKGKVERVCSAIRSELERQDETELKENYILPVLGTLVAVGDKIEEALGLIKKLRDAGKQSLCDEGLRFIMYSVDVNLLFNVALGTYDFELVLMVAEKSQKDPKEYLPILNKYKSMPEDYMKFTIDKNLKKFEAALNHIAKCSDKFDECLALVEEHRLHKQAMHLFPPGSDNYKCICRSYGEYMESKKYYLESSLLYERAGLSDQAVALAEKAGAWQRAGHLAVSAGWRTERLRELWVGLAGRMEEMDRGVESATIWKEKLQDLEECTAVLTRARSWQESIRCARDQGRLDLIETHVLPALRERRDTLLSTITNNTNSIQAQVARLEKVRELRSKTEDDDEAEEDRNLEDADIFSETTSVGGSLATTTRSKSTLATRQTFRSKSSKNRRKQDRKVYSTREGSTHEDLGLISELHEAITNVPGLVAEVATLVRALLELNQQDGLQQLQELTAKLLAVCEESKPRIWVGQEVVKDRFGPQSTVEDIVRGAAAVSAEYKSPLELMQPHLRFAPRFTIDLYWRIQIL